MHSPTRKLFLTDYDINSEKNASQNFNNNSFIFIITGRCGSTWLSKLLTETNCCGRVDEFFTEAFIPCHFSNTGRLTFNDYVKSLVNIYGFGTGLGFQIDPMRLSWLQDYKEMHVGNLFHNLGTIFYLTRNDLVGQAYSFARAKSSGIWHVKKGDSGSNTDDSIDRVPDNIMWQEMLSILHDEYWTELAFNIAGIQPIRLAYEDLVTDQLQTVARILIAIGRMPVNGLQLDSGTGDMTAKISYSARHHHVIEFYEKYFHVLKDVQELRRKTSSLKDYFTLLDDHRVVFNKNAVRWYSAPE